MAGIPHQEKVIVIGDGDGPNTTDRPVAQRRTISLSRMSRNPQNAIPDRTSTPYSRIGRASNLNNSLSYQHPLHRLQSQTPSLVTTSEWRSPPATSSSTTPKASSRAFSGLRPPFVCEPTVLSNGSLSGHDASTSRSKPTRSRDHQLENQAKRLKSNSGSSKVVDLDQIQRDIMTIDLEIEFIQKNKTAESFKSASKLDTRHYKGPQADLATRELFQPEPAADDEDRFTMQDYMTEEQFDAWLKQLPGNNDRLPHVRIPRSNTLTRPRPAEMVLRNGPISAPLVFLDSYNHDGINLRPNANVELHGGDFMRIVHVIRDVSTSAISLRGLVFRRAKDMNGILKKTLNEVCLVLHVDEDDAREPRVQGMEEVPVTDVAKRRAIKMTNQRFPALSFREHLENETEETISKNRMLVCRWKYVCFYKNAKAREDNVHSERVIQRLTFAETDTNCGIEDEQLRYEWRGDTIKGGACLKGTGSDRLQSIGTGQMAASPFALDPTSFIDLDPPSPKLETHNHHHQTDSTGKSIKTPESAPALRRKNQKVPHLRQMHRPTQMPCDLFHSIIDLTGGRDPEMGMYFVTASDRRATQLQTSEDTLQIQAHQGSPDVVEVAGHFKARSMDGIVEQQYEDHIASWHTYPAPDSWPKKKRVDSQTGTYSTQSVTKRGTPHSESASPLHSRAFSTDSGRKVGHSPSVGALVGMRKHAVPPCPDFRLCQRSNSQTRSAVAPTQRYTFGDAFCGAGGMSRGALMAGLQVEWGFDFNAWACKSYGLNFPDTSVYHLRADQFSSLQSDDHKVDFLHLSPPCQFFSPAHTIEGKDDEKNVASLFAIFELLNKARPRIVTLEQTAGLMIRHRLYFNAVILMLTEHGFNIRHKICRLQDFGPLAQTRDRLIMIASCPGEALPGYPKPTHSGNPQVTGLKPWATINEAISNIPQNAGNHDIAHARRQQVGPPYDGNKQINCITTGGGGAYHPSGRKFTHRELARLSGFPDEHNFWGVNTIRQIGNAVPPLVGKVILEEVIKALQRADGL